jgi:hypothetical protein
LLSHALTRIFEKLWDCFAFGRTGKIMELPRFLHVTRVFEKPWNDFAFLCDVGGYLQNLGALALSLAMA